MGAAQTFFGLQANLKAAGGGLSALNPTSFSVSIVASAIGDLVTTELANQFGVGSLGYKRDAAITQNQGTPNLLPSPDHLIQRYNQQPVPNLGWLGLSLAKHGIDLGRSAWLPLVQMSYTAAPLDAYLRAYYRHTNNGQLVPDGAGGNAGGTIQQRFRRDGVSRAQDQELLLSPPFAWGPAAARQLKWLGLVDQPTYLQMLSAAGCPRADDQGFLDTALQWLPDAGTLSLWAQRDIWDDALAGRLALDEAYNESPVAVFFAKKSGVEADTPALPNQPAGNTNWFQLACRAGVPLPGFGEAAEMQRRLRDDGTGSGLSVTGDAPAWTAADTRDILTAAGYTRPIVESLMGLVTQPINVRIIQTVLLEALKHPDVAAAAQAAYPDGTDWVLSAYLDHGFSPAVSALAASGIRAKANDEANAELIENQKALRTLSRTIAEKAYAAGTLDTGAAIAAMTDQFFTAGMAATALSLIDLEVKAAATENIVGVIRESYLSGKITGDQVIVQLSLARAASNLLAGVGMVQDRQGSHAGNVANPASPQSWPHDSRDGPSEAYESWLDRHRRARRNRARRARNRQRGREGDSNGGVEIVCCGGASNARGRCRGEGGGGGRRQGRQGGGKNGR